MIDESKQELLIGYLLNELDPKDAQRMEAEIGADPEVRDFVRETEEAFSSIAHTLEPKSPPTGLPKRIIALERASTRKQLPTSRSNIVWFAAPWALAACLAIACAILNLERARLQKRITEIGHDLLVVNKNVGHLESDLATLQKRNALAEVKILMLKAQVSAFESATAVVVWDKERKDGVLQLDKLPPPAPGKDYQLWVIDPKNPQPVSAGVLTVSNNGPIRTSFSPQSPIGSASAFAISVEKAGGASKPEGPIILVGS